MCLIMKFRILTGGRLTDVLEVLIARLNFSEIFIKFLNCICMKIKFVLFEHSVFLPCLICMRLMRYTSLSDGLGLLEND